MSDIRALLYKEVLRFWRVGFQTVGAPIITALLYLMIFQQVLGERVRLYDQVSYDVFLGPGLVMMSILQNAFANSASSLIQSKVTGNLVFVLVSPITPGGFFWAYTLASIIRGIVVGLGVLLVVLAFTSTPFVYPLWTLAFSLLGAAVFGILGLLAGLWAEKFDQLAVFQNFLIMPLTMLSGVFYSIHQLPEFWQQTSKFNPVFYFIDGFRYGIIGHSDVQPWLSFSVSILVVIALSVLTITLLKRGWRIKN